MHYIYIHCMIGLLALVMYSNGARADNMNPCEYLNMTNNAEHQLDTGNDENFERIKQQRNREIIIACQDYQIKLLETKRNDLNRDNY